MLILWILLNFVVIVNWFFVILFTNFSHKYANKQKKTGLEVKKWNRNIKNVVKIVKVYADLHLLILSSMRLKTGINRLIV